MPIISKVCVYFVGYQLALAFVYERLLENDDLMIILHFYHSPGDWSDYKAFIYTKNVRQFEKKDL